MKRHSYQELVRYISSIDAAVYAQRRNYLNGSTGLSEYITRGVISLPRVRTLLLKANSRESAYKLLNELAWREYWHLVWSVKGDTIFEYIRPLPASPSLAIPQSVLEATTGIKALDEGIRQLQQTGYIHNHMRLWLAGLICNVAHCDWKVGANWMHAYLIDGDYASNHLSWQCVAGSYTGKPYLPQQDNINTFTNTIQRGTYLDQPYEVITDMAVPTELATLVTSLPAHQSTLPEATITLEALLEEAEILLYSPWTLDPVWCLNSPATRVLLLDPTVFIEGKFSQNVIDSITWFADQIPDLKILYARPAVLNDISNRVIRKDYAGIAAWPGVVEPPELLYPSVEPKFYPSFSAFWKQAQK